MGDKWAIQSMFSGIGGLDLGVERALNAKCVSMCELSEQGRNVLARHWPDADMHDDVCTLDAVVDVDVLCAGFPCQDASAAFPKSLGGGKGLDGARTGLWSEVIRVVKTAWPKVVVLENVRNLLNVGFDVVLADLDECGYDVRWGVWTAAAVGAPHIRERLITVAVRRDFVNWLDLTDDVADVFPLSDESPDPFARGFDELLPEHDSGAWDERRQLDPEWQPSWAKRAASEAVQQRQIRAVGNAVCPTVAEIATRRTLAEWPAPSSAVVPGAKLPKWGAQVDGKLYTTAESVPGPTYKGDLKRGDWVRVQMRGEEDLMRPVIGRIVYAGGGCAVDVELPGGAIEPFDLDVVKRWWPTPTAHDSKDTGSRAQYRRKNPGLPSFTGGLGCVSLAEWAMGLPPGWTSPSEPS